MPNKEDIDKIENIVDRLYDDMEQRGDTVAYRRRNSEKNLSESQNRTYRRFDFAPALVLGPHKQLDAEYEVKDSPAPRIPWLKKWPLGIIPYFIDPNTYDSYLADTIVKAFDYVEKVTCIRMQRLREKPTDKLSMQNVEWLYISNPSGIKQCVHSNDQKPNVGVQLIVLGYECLSKGEIAHEVMHILGFWHEHTRPDRDQYITIHWENIKSGYKKYFETRGSDPLSSMPYDYSSVLHYPPRAFSKNGQATISAKPGIKIGQRDGLSEIDVEKVGMIFGYDCTTRNSDYLRKTCPSVIKSSQEAKPATEPAIRKYFANRIWPYGIINYKIRDNIEFSIEERENIKAVIKHIEKETCIQFRDGSEDEGEEVDQEENISTHHLQAESNKENVSDNNIDKNENDHDKTSENAVEKVENSNEITNDKIETDKDNGTDNDNTVTENSDLDSTVLDTVTEITTRDGSEMANMRLTYMVTNNYRTPGPQNNEIDNDDSDNSDSLRSQLRSNITVRKEKGQRSSLTSANQGKIPKQSRKQMNQKSQKQKTKGGGPKRRHAENNLVLARSAKPGCECPKPGRPNGSKILYINSDCFNSVNDLLHLFVHVLGLEHQHNMHDRDSFLHIAWDQLTPELKREMSKKLSPEASVGFAYDYQSVMHFPWLQIKNGVTNIMYPIWNDGWAMGHWQGLSSTDVRKINFIYAKECEKRNKEN